MRKLKKLYAKKDSFGATEYQVWREPWEDGKIQHIYSEATPEIAVSKQFDKKHPALFPPYGYIALPWIHLPVRKDKLKFRINIHGRWTLARHDDIAVLTWDYQTRYVDGVTHRRESGKYIQTQRMFYEDMEMITIDGEIPFPHECVRFLLGISGLHGSWTTWKKGIGLCWESISILGDVGREYIYILFDTDHDPPRYVRKYTRDLELVEEKENEGWRWGAIMQDGSIVVQDRYERAYSKKFGRYTSEWVKITEKTLEGTDAPITTVYEDSDGFLIGITTDGEKTYLTKYSNEFEVIEKCLYTIDPPLNPTLLELQTIISKDRILLYTAENTNMYALKRFCQGEIDWHRDLSPGLWWPKLRKYSAGIIRIVPRVFEPPVPMKAVFYDFEGNIQKTIEIPNEHPLANEIIWQIEITDDDYILWKSSSWNYDKAYLTKTDIDFNIIKRTQMTGPYEIWAGCILGEYTIV
jgi:hypothetical protein